MKKFKHTHITLLLFVVACLALNCTPKAKPASSGSSKTSSNGTSSKSDEEPAFGDMTAEQKMSVIANLSDQQYATGMSIYEAKCGKCHTLYDPKSRDAGGWLRVLHPMSKKANLSDKEHKEVAGYLYNNCKK